MHPLPSLLQAASKARADENRQLREANEKLHNSQSAEGRSVALLTMQVREMGSANAQLETERSSLKRRVTNAEEQLEQMQGAMSSNMAAYQKEIIKLRALVQQLSAPPSRGPPGPPPGPPPARAYAPG